MTSADVWNCLNDQLLPQILDHQPANFATLIFKAVNKICEIVHASKGKDGAAVAPLQPYVNNYTSSVHGGSAVPKGAEDPVVFSTNQILLNCLRVLTRCLSLLVEEPEGDWFGSWLWGGKLPMHTSGQIVHPLIERGLYGQRTLGQTIRLVLLDLLFTEGFTVHPSLATSIPNKNMLRHNGVQLDKLWEVSISPTTGFPIAGPPNLPNIHQWLNKSVGYSSYDANRIEVLRCLLVCCSDGMFLPPPSPASPPSSPAPPPDADSSSASSSSPSSARRIRHRFVREFISETSECARWTPTLFWSLLNLILNYHPEGQSMLSVPYSHTLYTDHREALLETSLHLLLILLDFRHGELESKLSPPSLEARKKAVVVLNPPTKTTDQRQTEPNNGASDVTSSLATVSISPPTPTTNVQTHASNVFHAIMTELSNPACLASIFTNLCRLLMNGLAAESTYLPSSLKKMYAFQELLILTWKFADENPAFIQTILHPPPNGPMELDVANLTLPLIYFVNESRQDSQVGLMYTCVFLLLKLSGDREFSVSLNRPIASVASLAHVSIFSLLAIPNITDATFADCLIVIAHKLIVSSPNHLDNLLKSLLTLLCNISPYLTRLSLFASVKLLNIFELFASPKFVNANSSNHQYATMLLDVFNNIIQYQYLGHANLVYSIIRRAKHFESLGRLELLPGEAEPITVEEQQRRLQLEQMRTTMATLKKEASAATSTIELAERVSASPANAAKQPMAIPAGQSHQGPVGTPVESVTTAPSASASSSSSSSLAPLSSSTVPVLSFVPTAEWANSWKRLLPLEPISRLLEFFEPKVDAIIKGKSVDQQETWSHCTTIVIRDFLLNYAVDILSFSFCTGRRLMKGRSFQ